MLSCNDLDLCVGMNALHAGTLTHCFTFRINDNCVSIKCSSLYCVTIVFHDKMYKCHELSIIVFLIRQQHYDAVRKKQKQQNRNTLNKHTLTSAVATHRLASHD